MTEILRNDEDSVKNWLQLNKYKNIKFKCPTETDTGVRNDRYTQRG